MLLMFRMSCSANATSVRPEADKPSEQRVVRERRGCGPNTDIEELARQRLNAITAVQQPERELTQRPLQNDQCCSSHGSDQQRSTQARHDLNRLTCTHCLCGQTRRPHAQKAEGPKQEREHERRNRDASDICSIGNASHDGGIDHPDQRRRHVRKHYRNRKSQNRAVRGT